MSFAWIAGGLAVMVMFSCVSKQTDTKKSVQNNQDLYHQENAAFAVKTTLKEMTEVDPEKGIGVYGRYTELTAEGNVPESLSRILAQVNERAKETVEAGAKRFLNNNSYPAVKGSVVTKRYRYHNISCIVNVTRADETLFSILETEMESGIGGLAGEETDALKSCVFHSSVYDTRSGKVLTLADFLQNPDSLKALVNEALSNKYACEALYKGSDDKIPAWTADYFGLRIYFDGAMVPEENRQESGLNLYQAVHVSIPYTALDGPVADDAAKTPESFIAQIEKNIEYALPYDRRNILVEKAADDSGREAYRIVIRTDGNEEAWWLEYADDNSDYYVFRAQGNYYFYRLDALQDRAYVYNFAAPDGGYGRFENQNAQCFDSLLQELKLAVPYNPACAHMREGSRKVMDSAAGLNTSFVPHGHYSFLPEPGRGRTWLHFSLIDDSLALDSRNTGCRLLHEISVMVPGESGKEGAKIVIPTGEILRFVRVDGEGELYYYLSHQFSMYQSGVRDYRYDCVLSDGRQVSIITRYETDIFVDGMYLNRIAEPVTLGAAQYEAGLGTLPDHFVEIAGKAYPLIRNLSLKSEHGEEIDFGGDSWWKVENYTGTFSSEEGDAKLVISENGTVDFEYGGKEFTGTLPEKRFYCDTVGVYMEAGNARRSFRIIIEDNLPPHDPSFDRICFYSEGEPATNGPSGVLPVKVQLIRETK